MADVSVIYRSTYLELARSPGGVDAALTRLLKDIGAVGREVVVRPTQGLRLPWKKAEDQDYDAFVDGVCIGKEGYVSVASASGKGPERAKSNLFERMINPGSAVYIDPDSAGYSPHQLKPNYRLYVGTLEAVIGGRHEREIKVIADGPPPEHRVSSRNVGLQLVP